MKTPILTPLDLSARIIELKAQKLQQEDELKVQFSKVVHSVSPGNLLKSGFHSLAESPLANGLIGTGLNLGVDLLSKKFLGNSAGPVKRLATKAISFGVGKILGSKAESIKAYATVLAKRILKGKNKENIVSS
jgi:hypothetical protein